MNHLQHSDDERAITWFMSYLSVKTVHPTPDYKAAAAFLKPLSDFYGFEWKSWEYVPDKPLCVMTWQGTDPSLSSILLNSHMDVVPAIHASWNSDPFTAIEKDGWIQCRGTQDMKSVGIQHIEAVGRLKRAGKRFPRTIHISFVPDEEIGGRSGVAALALDPERLRWLNIGLVLDEGLASPGDAFKFFYGERVPWWIVVTAKGNTGHGSQFIANTAVEKLHKVLTQLLEFREKQKAELAKGASCGITLGDVTSVNCSYLKAGMTQDGKSFSMNVVPPEAEAGFDIRIAPQVNRVEFKAKLDAICEEAGCTWNVAQGSKFDSKTTPLTDQNQWWTTLRDFFKEKNLAIQTEIFPAGTDAVFLRNVGYPAFGFSPMNHTPLLLHDHNERIHRDVFLRGIPIFEGIISRLASVPEFNPEPAMSK